MFNVGSVQGYLKLNTGAWDNGMKSANTSLKTLSRTFAIFGATAVGSMTLIMREFGKFDKAIRHATSVSETTEAQFKQMSDMALEASVRWNKAAASTAQAFYFLGSAGLTVTEQMQAFNTTIMLSRAMGSDLAKTVEGTVDIVRAFGLEFANIDKIADQLTKTVISSNQTFDILTKAMSYAASTAKMTNNTLAETTAMLGIMANAGIKGSMAGTVLRRAMANLMAPMGAMRGLVYELGLEIYNATGEMKPFVEIMEQISDRLAGASDEYKNLVFRTLFGVRALAGQIRLFDVGSEAISKYASEIKNAGNVTLTVAGKQMKALTEQMGKLWRQMQKITIITGQELAPAMKRVVDRLLEQAKAVEVYIKNNIEAIATTLKWVTVIGALAVATPIMISLMSSVLSLINPFTIVIGMLYLFRTVWGDMFKKNGELSRALDEFTDTLETWLREKFGVFGKILVMTVEGWGMLLGKSVKGWGLIRDDMDKFLGLKPETPTGFGEVIGKGRGAAVAVGKGMLAQFTADMKALVGLMGATMPPSMEDALDTLKDLLDLIMKEPVKPAVDAITDSVEELNKAITNPEPIKAIGKLADAWRTAVGEMFQPMVEDMETWHRKFVNVLTSIRSEWANSFGTLMKSGSSFGDFMDSLWQGILNSFRRMIAEIAANDLLYALTGGKLGRTEDMPTLLDLFRRPQQPPVPTTGVGGGSSYMEMMSEAKAGKPAPTMTVNVVNETGVPARGIASKPVFNGKEYIVNVVLEAMDTNPNVRARLAGG